MAAHGSAVVLEVVAERPDDLPGTVALLFDHAERRGLRLSWRVDDLTDDALLFRLAFGRHDAVPAGREGTGRLFAKPLAADPLAWLQGAQLAVGAAVRGEGPVRLVLNLAELDRPDAFSVVVEALDLIEGLVAAGRLRMLTLADLAEEHPDERS